MIIVDTNVLVDVLENDPTWANWSSAKLQELSHSHILAINPIIYAELTLTFDTLEDLDMAIANLGLEFLDLPRSALFLDGKAFARYRQQGGTKSNVLPDFFIGAHAAVLNCAILTRDVKRYSRYFHAVELIYPK